MNTTTTDTTTTDYDRLSPELRAIIDEYPVYDRNEPAMMIRYRPNQEPLTEERVREIVQGYVPQTPTPDIPLPAWADRADPWQWDGLDERWQRRIWRGETQALNGYQYYPEPTEPTGSPMLDPTWEDVTASDMRELAAELLAAADALEGR